MAVNEHAYHLARGLLRWFSIDALYTTVYLIHDQEHYSISVQLCLDCQNPVKILGSSRRKACFPASSSECETALVPILSCMTTLNCILICNGTPQ